MRIDTAETQGEKGVCTKPRMNQWAAFRFAKELIFAANACFFFVADCTCEIISLKNTRAPETGCECCVVMSSSSSVPLVAESCNNRLFKASVEGEAIPHLPGGPLRSSCNYRVEPTFTMHLQNMLPVTEQGHVLSSRFLLLIALGGRCGYHSLYTRKQKPRI